MNKFKAATVQVDVPDVGTIDVKQLTTKEYHTFMANEDSAARSRYLVQVSLSLTDDDYDAMPMALMPKLIDAVLKANGLHRDQHEAAVKN